MRRRFTPQLPSGPLLDIGDGAVLLLIVTALYLGSRIAARVPAVIRGPTISLDPRALPWYALLSVGRMFAAYLLSLVFALTYGYAAARNRTAERLLMPLLNVLQSVPILSFLPVVLLSLIALLPQKTAVEFASIILIFTSQAWNLTFSWYQSLKTTPNELRDVSTLFQLPPWLRFRLLEVPFAAIGLIWNSVMSWAGGWFFLMAAEMFSLGERDFRLPGLGSYLQTAANAGNARAVLWGIATLLAIIVLLDQLVWRPLLAWSERFRTEMVERDEPATSWFYHLLQRSRLLDWLSEHLTTPVMDRLDLALARRARNQASKRRRNVLGTVLTYALLALLAGGLIYGTLQTGHLLLALPLATWGEIAAATLATFLRVVVALLVALVWTVPLGVFIGTRPRAATLLQPIVQILASLPATALFPAFLLLLLRLPFGLDLAALLLMLVGIQWYILFNVIAGSAAIPRELDFSARLLQLRGWMRWRTLVLPAIFPYLITGTITAVGAAWNASVVAEYVQFGGRTYTTLGLGAVIAEATSQGDYALLLAATLTMIFVVVTTDRLFWHRLYRLAEDQYRIEME